jgi:cyclophilin family peptidyl-prolyl cis-trans isomerase
MKKPIAALIALACMPLLLAAAPPQPAPSPGEIVAAAPAGDWVAIAPSDLLVMDLAADAKAPSTRSGPRRVVIQLMPAPLSQGWIGNIRKLAAAHFWDGTSVNRVQDNYVVQWGDASEKKALPVGLALVPESEYVAYDYKCSVHSIQKTKECRIYDAAGRRSDFTKEPDSYGEIPFLFEGWPLAVAYYLDENAFLPGWNEPRPVFFNSLAPVHCYGMVGVGRNLSPDTGTGAELYTVIGHAPRHLDRNIALVGRVIEGIEHLSSLPRGTGALGFYEKPEERVAITAIRMGPDVKDLPAFQYLSTESESFAKYADARANRRDPFFIRPAGGADICNIPVPVRRSPFDKLSASR